MLSEAMQKAINDQINKELYSAYLYLAMSAHFDAVSLSGFAHWTRLQAQEEQTHAMKLFDFIIDRGGKVELMLIDKPPHEFGTPLDTFRAILSHEQKVTNLIHNLYKLAHSEGDLSAQVMLHWFIDEQVEEEKNASFIVDQLQMAEDHKGHLLTIDHATGKREE